jgi:hypothetical protein
MAFFDENLAASVTQETDASLVSLGQRGFVYVSDTTATPGNFAAIQVLEVAQFSALSALNSTVGGLVGVTLTAGTIIYGPFTGFTLASGKVIAYKAG